MRIILRKPEVTLQDVNWTSIIYMIIYPFLIVPVSCLIKEKGLRVACLIGCIGTAIGTILKVFSIGNDRFWVVLLGQFITASSMVFIMCLPPKIAAIWFKPHEVSLACSLGTLGPNMGNAFGYLLTVSIVSDNNNLDIIGDNLRTLCWTLSILIVPVTIAVICYLPKEPLHPPSQAQAQARIKDKSKNRIDDNTFSSIKNLMRMDGFLLHMISYAINIGVLSTIMILLSEFVNAKFPKASDDAGRMGFCMMAFGMLGSVLVGVYLDRYHHYKGSCIFLYLMSTLSVILLIVSLEYKSIQFSYTMCSIFGIFINPFIPAGFEFGIELTHPHEESTVAGLLFASSQLLSVIFAVTVSFIHSYFGSFYALVVLAVLLSLGTLVETCVPNILKRQDAFQKDKPRHVI